MSRSGCINKIPVTWQSVCLSDIFYDPQNDIVSGPFGSDLKTSDYTNDGVPILRIQNIKRNEFVNKNIKYTSQNKADQLDRHNYKKGDIVITKLGDPVGKACIISDNMDDGIIIADLVRARLNHSLVSKKFIVYQLNSERVIQQFKAKTKGTTRPRVNLNQVRELNIALPPLKEQHRIVAKIEELFSEIDHAEEELKKAKRQLETYRQALFKSAFEYRDSWNTYRVQDVFELIDGDRGKNYPKQSDYLDDGYCLFLSTKNVRSNYFSFEEKVFILKEKHENLRNGTLQRGDIALTTRGTLGNVALYDETIPYSIVRINSGMVIMRCKDASNNLKYLSNYIISPFFKEQIKQKHTGTAQPQLPLSILKNFEIAIPCKKEQDKIVSELETKISLMENLSNTIDMGLKKNKVFRSAILIKAFKGELVPQNPDDKDASNLLQKIKKEKEDYLNVQKEFRGEKPKGKLIMKKDKSIKEILKEVDSPIEAEELWLQSKHEKDIEAFYAELKKIETEINIETKGKKSLIGLKR